MINAGIFEGDLVIVSPQTGALNNEIIVALIEDEVTVKRFG
jgi:repressor LexA